jgi:RimJ/RimL family protein N-acetyltransferase
MEQLQARRSGRWIKLVPFGVEHTDFVYRLSTDEETGYRWRFAGAVPSPDVFQQSLWAGVLTQFVVLEKGKGSLVGSVVAYNADLHHGHAYVGCAMVKQASETGLGVEATDVFLHYLFRVNNLRKIYFEVPSFNMPQFESAIGWIMKEEGRLNDHFFYGGRYWDRHVLAVYRADYEALDRTEDGTVRFRTSKDVVPGA